MFAQVISSTNPTAAISTTSDGLYLADNLLSQVNQIHAHAGIRIRILHGQPPREIVCISACACSRLTPGLRRATGCNQ